MAYLEDVLAWAVKLDWPTVWKLLKDAGDYKEIAILFISSLTAVALFFVKNTLKKTVREIRADVTTIKSQLDESSRKFHQELETAIKRLGETTQVTLDRVDMAGDALAKKVDFVKKEIEVVIEDAFARAGVAANSNIPMVGATGEKDTYWDEMRELWEQTRREFDNRIATVISKITDGRRRRRYENLDKRSYEAVILKFYEDNWIDDDASNALLEMNLLFNSRKNKKRRVSKEELEQFLAWRQQWLTAGQVEVPVAAE